MAQIESFTNNASTTLNGSIDSSQTSITVSSASGFPSLSYQKYRIIIDNELMLVTGGQGTTTWTVTRGIESSSTASHSSGVSVTHIVTAASLTQLKPSDNLWVPANISHTLDDEFDDNSIDGAWIRVDNSSDAANVTWTESGNLISMKNVGAGVGGRYHALLKSLGGRSFPITIDAATRHLSQYAISYFMLGIGFADGTTYGAGSQITTRFYTRNDTATAVITGIDGLANFLTASVASDPYRIQVMGGPFYHRIVWSAANTFQAWVSVDGVSWIQFISNYSYTITPTHFGIFTSNWGSGQPTIGSIEYIRIYESNKFGNP